MGTTNIRHLWAYRFPAEAMPEADEDHFVLVDEFTDNRTFNPDGTKFRDTCVIAHGPRDRIDDAVESMIDTGMIFYRSSNYGDDYFRAGVENAIDDATDVTDDPIPGIEVAVSCGDDASDEVTETIESVIAGAEWSEVPDDDRRKARAALTPSVMQDVATVDDLFGGPVDVGRTFTVDA